MLRVWCFECKGCKHRVLLCTRCLRRRRYCSEACAAQARRVQNRDAVRKYQGTDKGRRSHCCRSRRYRQKQCERRKAGRPRPEAAAERAVTVAPAPASLPSDEPEPPSPPATVTHHSRGPESRLSARVGPALMVAALRVTGTRGAEEPRDAERRAEQATTGRVGGERAAARTRPETLAELPGRLARCACCGRVGQLVVFDGELAVVRGQAPG
jgi:hypothetical protein